MFRRALAAIVACLFVALIIGALIFDGTEYRAKCNVDNLSPLRGEIKFADDLTESCFSQWSSRESIMILDPPQYVERRAFIEIRYLWSRQHRIRSGDILTSCDQE